VLDEIIHDHDGQEALWGSHFYVDCGCAW
jgi:hypothetical protein